MDSMDKNGDKLLTLTEYTGLDIPRDQVMTYLMHWHCGCGKIDWCLQWSKEDEDFFKSREQEFRDMVDNNADGVVDKVGKLLCY